MAIFGYVELPLSWLLRDFLNHDARLFTKGPAFNSYPKPGIDVISPSCGPSGSVLQPKYSQMGEDCFPSLGWLHEIEIIKEYILICEDADMPLPGPIVQRVFHGIYYSIPPATTMVAASDLETARVDEKGGTVKGGFKFTKNFRGVAYAGAKPVLGHAPHRYFYQLVALKEPLELGELGFVPSEAQLATAIEGNVLGWGVWVGVFGRKWR